MCHLQILLPLPKRSYKNRSHRVKYESSIRFLVCRYPPEIITYYPHSSTPHVRAALLTRRGSLYLRCSLKKKKKKKKKPARSILLILLIYGRCLKRRSVAQEKLNEKESCFKMVTEILVMIAFGILCFYWHHFNILGSKNMTFWKDKVKVKWRIIHLTDMCAAAAGATAAAPSIH
jgi:hypothetical protein